ncbi:MAG: hypothetical protein K9M98_11855 [Cephaloticoccus sp.]|nr:hypothetical protein [Cephaloticoccus sp.]MCF7761187.1 hypothetical protein [Cephaloticoccus sp.]
MRQSSHNSESAAHQELKNLALTWAESQRLVIATTEVRLPRSNYRADVAAATLRCLSDRAWTAVFECKVSRADYLRDSAPESPTAETVGRLSTRLNALRQMIGAHRPDLRRGEELFPEYEAYDLRGLRHTTHDKLTTALRIAQRKLQDGTKFAKLGRWRAASLLYVVAEPDLLLPHEIPDGWGLLVRKESALELVVKPCLNPTSPAERVALLERIAAVATRPGRGESNQIMIPVKYRGRGRPVSL